MHIKCLGKVDIKYIGIDFDKNFKLKGGIKNGKYLLSERL